MVCPSALMNKWRSELRERFDLDFEIFDGPSWRGEIDELARLGDAAPLRGIASLESLAVRRTSRHWIKPNLGWTW